MAAVYYHSAAMLRVLGAFIGTRAILCLAFLSPWPSECRSYEYPAPHDPTARITVNPEWKPLGAPEPNKAGRLWQITPDAPWLDAFARFDAHHYLMIAGFGYADENKAEIPLRAGFLPGFPLAIRYATMAINRSTGGAFALPQTFDRFWTALLAAFLVNSAAFLFAILLIRSLVTESTGDADLGDRAALWLCVAPTSFFFTTAMSEALFLAVTTGAFLLAWRRRFLWAALLGAVAAFSRPFGMLLVAPLAVAVLERRRSFKEALAAAACLPLVPLGFAAAAWFQSRDLGVYDGYFRAQASLGHESFPTLAGISHLFAGPGKPAIALTRDAVQIAALAFAIVLAARLASAARSTRFHFASAAWCVVAILFPILADDVVSLPRYLAAIWPLYLGVALLMPGGRRGALIGLACFGAQIVGMLGFSRNWPIVL